MVKGFLASEIEGIPRRRIGNVVNTREPVFVFAAVALIIGPTTGIGSDQVSAKGRFDAEARAHWSFQKVTRPNPPAVTGTKWVRNPIDAFILADLEAKQIQPAVEADKLTLLRRAYLDLIGLPPSPKEADAFLADKSPQAFEKVVDQLLASPHYGERWARHWLDLARYAESEGFKEDETRPNIWRYRDYVIQSFNSDKPYDKFIREQIAGDELWPDSAEARIATGFNRHYPDEHNARDLRQRRQEILNDITDTVGGVFSGMTFACARCHDHKFDPILQTDYYRLQAFFANIAAADEIPLVSSNDLKRYQEKLAAWEDRTRVLREQMAEIEAPKRKEIEEDLLRKYPQEIQDAIAKRPEERTSIECLMYLKAKQYLDPKSHQYVAPTTAVVAKLKGEQKDKWRELKVELDTFKDLLPQEIPMASGIADASREAPKTYLLSRGLTDHPRDELEPGFLQILHPEPAQIAPCSSSNSTGRRTALANILTDPENPLTARVMANRIWHYHFGRGIVGTPSDFGLQGDRPANPALLDWLASEMMSPKSNVQSPKSENQRLETLDIGHWTLDSPRTWSLKHIHRLIVTSSTYRQSTQFNPAAARIDPDDKLLWRFPRHRLEGEIIRDQALAVSGLLNTQMGGPSIFPELPPGMAARGGWKSSADEEERNRRSIYVFVKRNTRYPMFESFDMPDTHESCPRRNVTTSPVQALTLLNSDLTLQWAQAFAGRVIESAGANFNRQIETAFRLAYSRLPDESENNMAREFFQRHRSLVAERAGKGEELALPPKLPKSFDPSHAATLVDFCHMLINANEFVFIN